MSVTLTGLKNCDTCRKANQWLAQAGVDYRFVDIRGDAVVATCLRNWLEHNDWQSLLNRRSRTWRELPESARNNLDEAKAVALMQAQPTLIKRPVLEYDDGVLVGFSAADYETVLAADGANKN